MSKIMKALSLAMVMILLVGVVEPSLAVDVYYKNKIIKTDVPPIIDEGRTMVPLAVIAEALGADVEWKHATKQIIITKGTDLLVLAINEKHVVVTKKGTANIHILDVPPSIKSGRTFVPLGFISSFLGNNVEWDGVNKTVLIDSDREVVAEMIRQQLIALERARNVQTIITSVKTDPYFKTLNLKPENFLYYDMKADDVIHNKTLANISSKYPGKYELYTYPIASPKRYETFYFNTTTRNVYVEAQPLKFIYQYPGKKFVIASYLEEGTEADYIIEALKSNGYFDGKAEYVATVTNRGTDGIAANNVVVNVKKINNDTMENVGDFYLNIDTLSIYDSDGRRRFDGPQ